MHAFVEITSGVLRFGEFAFAMGDPYDRACSFVCVDGRHAVLKGWVGRPTGSHRRAAELALLPLRLLPDWRRMKPGQTRLLTARGLSM